MNPQEQRSARVAVTIFPALVVVAGVFGFLLPEVVTPLAPSVTWLLGGVMFFMGLTLTVPDFTQIVKKPWIAAVDRKSVV